MAELRQRIPVVKRRRKQSRSQRDAESVAQARFKAEVLALDRYRCVLTTVFPSQHRCEGPLEAHHVVKAQWLRTHISSLDLTEEEINDWLWSAGVGCTLCRRAHESHTSRMAVVPLEHLPNRVVDWCEDRSVGHLLRREHPPLFPKGDR